MVKENPFNLIIKNKLWQLNILITKGGASRRF